MASPDFTGLSRPQQIAIAYTPRRAKPALAALLAFDGRLARSLSGTSEPLLAQMRLAWWREELAKPVENRARGEAVLAALGESWDGGEAALIALVDGWEHLLGEAPLSNAALTAFGEGRGAAFAALAGRVGVPAAADDAQKAGHRWALADLAFRVSDPTERARCRALFDEWAPSASPLPKALRGVAVLDGLSRRAIARGEPLMAGRGGALAAMRLGLTGR